MFKNAKNNPDQLNIICSCHLKISFFVVISVSSHCLQQSEVHCGGKVGVTNAHRPGLNNQALHRC